MGRLCAAAAATPVASVDRRSAPAAARTLAAASAWRLGVSLAGLVASSGLVARAGATAPPRSLQTGFSGTVEGRTLPPGVEVARLFGNINKYAYYFMDLMIGSPEKQETSVIVDTGSRLLGFPCKGCDHCGHHINAPFDFSASTSARWLECGDTCSGTCQNNQCTYQETYSEGSSIEGRWFDDVVELGESNPQVRVRMGCHASENKLFYTQRANGIMGLAPRGNLSDVSRPTILQDLFMDKQHVNSEIFAMCLATWGGELTVGGYDPSFHEQGATVQWTPMRASHYYFAFPEELDMVNADGSQETTNVIGSNGEFGITIIDSGTTYVFFPTPVYRRIVDTLDQLCAPARGGCGGAVREGSCFRLRDARFGPVDFPTIKMQFRGGAKVEWSPDGYLHERGQPGVWCQTFMENSLYQTVLGISWMMHKNVIFDVRGGRLGIAKAKCPENHKQSDYIRRDEVAAGRVGDLLGSMPEATPQLRRPAAAPLEAAARLPRSFAAWGLPLATAAMLGWLLAFLRGRALAGSRSHRLLSTAEALDGVEDACASYDVDVAFASSPLSASSI